MKAYTRKQKVIAKSSAEAELYASALGASEAKGVQNMMRDLGFAVKTVLNIDAKATRVHRVRSEENVADLGTKPLSKAVIAKHCLTLGYVNVDEENVQSEL